MENTNISSDWKVSGSNQTITPIGNQMWEPLISDHNLAYSDPVMFLPSVSGIGAPQNSAFIDQCFGSGNLVEMMNPFSLGYIQESMQLQMNEMDVSEVSKEPSKYDKKNENMSGNESEEAEFSGQCVQEESSSKGFGSVKRKRHPQSNPQPSIEMSKDDAEINPKVNHKGTSVCKNVKEGSQGSDLPKEDYIHVRARRGQATNSHSLAERVRREKISERMKFLQDLVPGCNKVTGKAVMLDEIINYVQSLQRQVEFLSMKLATVNPHIDFDIEGLLTKDILQHSMSPSLTFPSEMTMPFPSLHHQSPPGLILANNSSKNLQKPVNLQSIPISNGFREPMSQVLPVWEDELDNIVHIGFNSSVPPNSHDVIGSLQLGHMKPEP